MSTSTATVVPALQLTPPFAALYPSLSDPDRVFHYLFVCLATPRPSHDLDQIREKMKEYAKFHNFDCAIDAAGNVRIRRPAAPGYENSIRVVIQSHLDMVTSKTMEKEHDFTKQGITPIIENGWIKADRTTLGADDGIGVAATLALLEDRSVPTGQLEALMTADEETTMGGAENIEKAPFLTGEFMINVDSEEPNCVCIGCAGGFERRVAVAVAPQPLARSEEYVDIDIFLHSLAGGHTGIDINKPRANALQLMGRLLDSVAALNIRIRQLKGGNAPNAIPRDCRANIAVSKQHAGELVKQLAETYEQIKSEFELVEKTVAAPGEDDKKAWKFEVTQTAAGAADYCSEAESRKMIDMCLTAPHGVLRMVPGLEGAVDLSVAFSMAAVDNGEFFVHLFCRGSSIATMKAADKRFQAYARLVGARESSSFNGYPGWEPNVRSLTLEHLKRSHRELFNYEPRIYSVHAGLECSLIQAAYPSMDCASIGPLIEDAHSPDEKLKIDTVYPFYQWLRKTVANMAEQSKDRKQ